MVGTFVLLVARQRTALAGQRRDKTSGSDIRAEATGRAGVPGLVTGANLAKARHQDISHAAAAEWRCSCL